MSRVFLPLLAALALGAAATVHADDGHGRSGRHAYHDRGHGNHHSYHHGSGYKGARHYGYRPYPGHYSYRPYYRYPYPRYDASRYHGHRHGPYCGHYGYRRGGYPYFFDGLSGHIVLHIPLD